MIEKRKTRFDHAIERAEFAATEAELAAVNYHIWMAEWRKRNGHTGPYDQATGLPLRCQGCGE